MIELQNIHVRAGNFHLQDVSMTLQAGKFHVLLGPSGSGKTVLLETIAGLTRPLKGHILSNGQELTKLPLHKRNISYLPQDNALFPHKNVFENIAYGLRLKKNLDEAAIRQKVLQIADALHISSLLDRGVGNLSGGEQQRIALARALVLDNSLLLLDEPTSSLQETMQENFCMMIKDIQQRYQLTVLMTTHHKDSAFMVADVMHFIEAGQLLLSIPLSKLLHSSVPLKVAEILGISNLLTLKKMEGEQHHYFCEQTDCAFTLGNLSEDVPANFLLGIRPLDIWVIKEEDFSENHPNSFNVKVASIYYKENDAVVMLEIPLTGFLLKMELSVHHLKSLKIVRGANLRCKLKEEHVRVVY